MTASRSNYDAYDAMDGFRATHLKRVLRHTPAHLRYDLDHPAQDTDTGSRKALRANHAAILEGLDVLARDFGVCDERRGTKAHAAWMADNPNRTDIKQGEWDTAVAIATAIQTHPVTRDLFPGAGEVPVQWVDEESGLTCKALLDAPRAAHGLLIDLKTVGSVAEHDSVRLMSTNNWHVQMAHHLPGAIACGVLPPGSRAGFLMIEQKPPHDLALYILSPLAMAQAEKERRQALTIIAECTRTGIWPGRYQTPMPIDLPLWRYEAGMENEDINMDDTEIP